MHMAAQGGDTIAESSSNLTTDCLPAQTSTLGKESQRGDHHQDIFTILIILELVVVRAFNFNQKKSITTKKQSR